MILKRQGQQWLCFFWGQNKTGPSIMDSPVKKERGLCKVGYFVLLAN